MKITIGGYPGSGKTTVANVIAEKLKLKHVYMGAIRRKLARDKGMTLDELNKLGETEDWTDKEPDKILEKLGKEEDNFLAEGRVAFYFIPDSIKILMKVDLKEGAKRIFKDQHEKGQAKERNESVADDIEGAAENLQKRIDSDIMRYEKYYGIDCYDEKHYDLVIDTTDITPEEAIQQTLDFINKKANL
ncbi:cytidylate kinase family protein [Nanoarchaeota archaeon]